MTASGLGAWLGCAHTASATEANGLSLSKARPFFFEELVQRARRLASEPYRPPPRRAAALVEQIDYDVHGQLHFDRDQALFARRGTYPVTFFPVGKLFPYSIRMHVVEDQKAREIRYDPGYFDMPVESVAQRLPPDAGFAGFRLHERISRADWKTQDWLAFLGASYFRSIGALGQYGLSARGVAVNTSIAGPEEFPLFTEFYLERASTARSPVRIHALLDGPSLAGAFQFLCHREQGVRMEVDARLFPRVEIEQLGIAPLTSMFWFAQHNRPERADWRPEVHDSDGLAVWTRSGERLFRPLNNPPRVITSSFVGDSPRGFGLVQRDRDPEHYLDGVQYERRPTLWVEPLGDWGAGSVQLIEIPTDAETHDNIVAFWRPAKAVGAGSELQYRYRLHWVANQPFVAPGAGRVFATRMGRGGEPGQERPPNTTRFVVEFQGDRLATDTESDAGLPGARVDASRGRVLRSRVERVPRTRRLRVVFDLEVEGSEPVELRTFLRRGDAALTETWTYQFHPHLGSGSAVFEGL